MCIIMHFFASVETKKTHAVVIKLCLFTVFIQKATVATFENSTVKNVQKLLSQVDLAFKEHMLPK